MTRIAICGLGNIGRVHLGNLQSMRGCRVAGLFDTDPARLQSAAEASGARPYSSIEEMLREKELDAIVVATPAGSHRELAVRAIESGKHVFVEKPLAATLEDAAALTEAAKHGNCVAQAGFCERFNANYLEAKRVVVSGQLGRIRSIQSARVAPYSFSNPDWDLGVLDTAVHNFDLILWLMGRAPRSVMARGVQVYPDSSIPHSVTTLLTFEDGALAVDNISWTKDGGHPLHLCARSRMTIQGENGTLVVDLSERPVSVVTDEDFRQIDTVILGGAGYYGCLKLQFEAFLKSIEEGSPVLAPLEDALLVERVALAAQASLRSGRELRLEVPV